MTFWSFEIRESYHELLLHNSGGIQGGS